MHIKKKKKTYISRSGEYVTLLGEKCNFSEQIRQARRHVAFALFKSGMREFQSSILVFINLMLQHVCERLYRQVFFFFFNPHRYIKGLTV